MGRSSREKRRRKLAREAIKALMVEPEAKTAPSLRERLKDPAIRKIVEDGMLKHAFQDAVFPTLFVRRGK